MYIKLIRTFVKQINNVMRKQEQIDYSDVMHLGFKEELADDKVYENRYGFPYSIITFNLISEIYLDWNKVDRVVNMHKVDNEHYIKATLKIYTLEELKELINFFEA